MLFCTRFPYKLITRLVPILLHHKNNYDKNEEKKIVFKLCCLSLPRDPCRINFDSLKQKVMVLTSVFFVPNTSGKSRTYLDVLQVSLILKHKLNCVITIYISNLPCM